VLISEIFPNTYRAAGQSLGSTTHWVFAALLTTVFPLMVSRLAPGTIFLFFCAMMALQLVWVLCDGAGNERRAARGNAAAVGACVVARSARPGARCGGNGYMNRT
jgi:hypothetical protein